LLGEGVITNIEREEGGNYQKKAQKGSLWGTRTAGGDLRRRE